MSRSQRFEIVVCPFCVSKKTRVKLHERNGIWALNCENCGARGPICSTRVGAIQYWNRRNENECHSCGDDHTYYCHHCGENISPKMAIDGREIWKHASGEIVLKRAAQ